jgi:hypothetical protein
MQIAPTIGIKLGVGACGRLFLKLYHLERRLGFILRRVIPAHDFTHLCLGGLAPPNLHHLTTSYVAHHAVLPPAQHEVRRYVVIITLHYPRIGDRVDPPGWLPVAADLAYRHQFVGPDSVAPRSEDYRESCDEGSQRQGRTANNQEYSTVNERDHLLNGFAVSLAN